MLDIYIQVSFHVCRSLLTSLFWYVCVYYMYDFFSVFVYVRHIHVYICIYICIYINMYISIIYECQHIIWAECVHTYANINIYLCVFIYIYINLYIHIYICTYIYMYTYIYINIYINNMYTYICIYIYRYI